MHRAVALLARRDYSRLELSRRLRLVLDDGADSSEIDAVLDKLEARGLLSDQRFAQSLSRWRAARFGAARVRADLKSRGVAEELIGEALAPLVATDLERARAIWQRRYRGMLPHSPAERARQMRFLAGRGFSAETIRKVLGAGDDASDPVDA